LLKLLREFSPVKPFVVKLIFPHACCSCVFEDVLCPGCRSTDVDVGLEQMWCVARQPVSGAGGLGGQPRLDALGAAPWGERARKELRASGETSRRRTHALADALSPQELQIAQLAASGLSNKEIGQQLFLSHRTVGSHLYRIFPKLGITARSHLRAALQSQS